MSKNEPKYIIYSMTVYGASSTHYTREENFQQETGNLKAKYPYLIISQLETSVSEKEIQKRFPPSANDFWSRKDPGYMD